jgi:hypothetical protein
MPCSPLLFLIGHVPHRMPSRMTSFLKVCVRTSLYVLLHSFHAHLDWAVFSSEPVTASMLHSSFALLDWDVFSSEPVTASCCTSFSRIWIGLCSPQNLLPPVAALLSRASGLGCVLLRTCYRQYVALLFRASGLGCVLLRTCYRRLFAPLYLVSLRVTESVSHPPLLLPSPGLPQGDAVSLNARGTSFPLRFPARRRYTARSIHTPIYVATT